MERFRSHFGVGPKAIVKLLNDLEIKHHKRNEYVEHVMMALCWLKLYETEHVLAGRWQRGEEFCRETIKKYVSDIQQLKKTKICFPDCHPLRIYLGSIDTVHFEVNEFRTDPNSKWYSHKHNGAGLSYEIFVDLCDNKVIWTAGPKPASTHDVTFFRGGKVVSKSKKKNEAQWDKKSLYFKILKIPKGKKLIGDSAYQGEPEKISTSMEEQQSTTKEFFARAKSRQETLHSRMKFFKILDGRFRHGKGSEEKMKYHKTCFEAVLILVQYGLENVHPLFEI